MFQSVASRIKICQGSPPSPNRAWLRTCAEEKDDMNDMLPLSGIRVLDWTRLLPGPVCTQLLSDFGADVIKIEQRGIGDPSRHNAPKYKKDSVYFHSVNSGKRGLTIDLAMPGARGVTERLIANC